MKLKKYVLAGAILCLASLGAAPNYRCTFTYSGYTGSTTLENFPVLVKFAADNPKGFSYSQLKPGQTDLKFVDQNGTALKYEVETWDESGTSAVWVQVPELTASSVITATWGDPEATTTPAERVTTSLWSDLGYAGVWHMNESTAGVDALDESGNGNTLKVGDSAKPEQMVSVEGAAGTARTVTTDWSYNYFETDSALDSLRLGQSFTVSAWVKGDTKANARLFCKKSSWSEKNGWEVQWNSASTVTPRGSAGDNDGAKTVGSIADWRLVSVVFDGTVARTYSNGALVGENTITAIVENDLGFSIGKCSGYNCNYAYDEVRLIAGVRSADWLKAEYDTVKGTSFCTVGKVIDLSAFNKLTIEAELDSTKGMVSPAYGASVLADGQVVDFSAPSGEFENGDGRYIYYTGYRLYVTDGEMNETLLADSSELSGSYTHTNNTFARLVWKQARRSGGTFFETAYASLVSVPGYTEDATLYNVPVPVRIAENSPEGFRYEDVQTGGTDILFTDMNGHVLSHEIETWDTAGTSVIWVNLPSLKKGMTFRFCYGNENVTTAQNTPSDVWVDRGYAGVWHLGEVATEGTETSADSTANGNTATPGGAKTAEMVSMDGIAGRARTIASTSVINWLSVADADSLDLGDTFTASCWLKATALAGNGRILEKKNGNWANVGWEIQWYGATLASPTMTMRGSTSDNNGVNAVAVGTSLANWTQLTFVYEGLDIKVYVNGVYAGHSPITKAAADNTYPLRFGSGAAYRGAYDEVRLVGGAATPGRIKAEYDAIANASFLSLGKVVAAGDANTFTVESADTERGTVTPAWGTTKNLQPGALAFSAPSGTIPTAEVTNSFKFTGYKLYVTADGIEHLEETSEKLSGTYTHVAGQSARLVWSTVDMPQVKVTPTVGGTVSGTGYITLGTTASLTATPNEGYRFVGWSGTLPAGVRATDLTISFTVDKAYDFVATFAEKTVTTAFFGWSGHAEGATVTAAAAANDIGTETFVPDSVNQRIANVALPAFSRHHPSATIYTDALRTEVLATNPGSIFFAPNGAGDISFGALGGWITRQSSCTIEFFLQADECKQYRGVWSMAHEGDQAVVFAPDSGAGIVRYSIEASSNGNTGYVKSDSAARGATSDSADGWQHIALVYDRDRQTVTFYRNYGVGQEKTTKIVSTDGNVPLYLGSAYAKGSNTGNAFRGWVSCLRVTKGTLEPDAFMRAGFDDATADGTIAYYDFRGSAGTSAAGATPKIGDRTAYRAVVGSTANTPVYSDDIPDTAIFANASAVAAKTPLSKRLASVYFNGSAGSYLQFCGLSSALAASEAYTLEMFVKPQSTGTWKAAVSWNDIGALYNAKPFEVQIPAGSAKTVRLQLNCAGKTVDHVRSENVADGKWHHVAVSYTTSDKLYRLYYDYAQVGTLDIGSSYVHKETAAPLVLGTMINNLSGELFTGYATGLRLSNRALSTDEFLVAAPKPQTGLTLIVR